MERPPFRAIGRAVFFAFRGYCQLTILRTARMKAEAKGL